MFDATGGAVEREVVTSALQGDAVSLGPYRHFMQKELFEQPEALAATLGPVAAAEGTTEELFGGSLEAGWSTRVDSVLILGCGTSSHAGMVAK